VATVDEVRQAIYDSIVAAADTQNAVALRDLAEAFAWLRSPSQSHGGGASVEKK
jgi:hypothetical protein